MTDAANAVRGEDAISLGGVPHVLRPSYEAIIAFEKDTHRSSLELARAAAAGGLVTEDAAAIVTRCVQAWGRAAAAGATAVQKDAAGVNAARVGALLVEEGLLLVNERLKLLLYMVVTGGVTASGEAKARPKPPTTDAIPDEGSPA